MAGTQVRVEGARELSSSLRAASADLGDLTREHSQAGGYVAQVARGLAPVRSGRLVGSIRAQAAATQATVSAGVIYAGPIHWGWPARNIAPQPFLTDALAQAESSAVDVYAGGMARAVNRIRGK